MKIFISYRRQDSTVITGRIYDRLVAAFGERTVFRDIDDIPAGKDFRAVLETEVGKSNVMLVIIGPQWAGITDSHGNKRLFDPNDFVRIEVESGLKRPDITVIPVLAMGASMPAANELPDSLQELAYRNAVMVRNDPDFDYDTKRLIHQLKRSEPIVQRLAPGIGIGFLAIIFLAFLWWAGSKILSSSSPDTPAPTLPINTPHAPGAPSDAGTISVGAGFGARGDGWQLYFTNPSNNQRPAALIDVPKLIGTTIIASRGISLYEQSNQDSMIVSRLSAGDAFLVTQANADNSWMRVQMQDHTNGWMLTDDIVLVSATPLASSAKSQYGINIRLIDAIGRVRNTLDIAAFMLDEKEITKAILEAYKNGVKVRVVTDDENGLDDPEGSAQEFVAAGIPVVGDERGALMHHKFMILDGNAVWTGSWNYTENSTFNNNENAIVFDSPQIAALYEAEFNKMFEQHQFGPHKPSNEIHEVNLAEGPVDVYFTPEDNVEPILTQLLSGAQKSIRLLTFSFTNDAYRDAILAAMQRGVKFQGIVEKKGWEVGEFPALFCAHAETRSDGNPYLLHHDVFIIDEAVIITGSMAFSKNALENNDENVLVIHSEALAKAYYDEFDRLWSMAKPPTDFSCSTSP